MERTNTSLARQDSWYLFVSKWEGVWQCQNSPIGMAKPICKLYAFTQLSGSKVVAPDQVGVPSNSSHTLSNVSSRTWRICRGIKQIFLSGFRFWANKPLSLLEYLLSLYIWPVVILLVACLITRFKPGWDKKRVSHLCCVSNHFGIKWVSALLQIVCSTGAAYAFFHSSSSCPNYRFANDVNSRSKSILELT